MPAEKLKSRQNEYTIIMKKLLLFISAFCICSLAATQAQTNKGNWLSGLSSSLNIAGAGSDLMGVGFSSWTTKSDAAGFEEHDPDKTSSINLLPKFGYFVTDNFVFGVDVSLMTSTTKNGGSDSKSITTMFAGGPFVRYYFPAEKAMPFFEVNGSFGGMNNKYDPEQGETTTYKSSIMIYGGGVGIAAPVSDKITFDVLIGYNSFTMKDKEDNEDNYRDVINTIGVKLGFIIFLGEDS